MIGAGSVVIREVPPHSTVVGVPGRIASDSARKDHLGDLDHDRLPDPLAKALQSLSAGMSRLEKEVEELRQKESGDD
jgi:serine O-acetyltransferase